ncbi:MAG: hypothetical protein WAU78_00700 [Roseiarcus sp.]
MRDFDLIPTNAALVESEAQVPSSAIGLFAKSDFAQARAELADLASYADYDDWLDSREGLQIGLAMAGVDATTVCVSLSSFLEWRDLTGATSDQRVLDTFARMALAMRNSTGSRVFAVVHEFDFSKYFRAINAFAEHGEYRSWLRHRQAIRAKTIAADLRVEELPVRVASFVEWCACLGQSPSEAALDRYAQLLLEHLTSDAAGLD